MSGVAEGLRYALGRKDLLGTYVIDIVAMLMAMPIVLFPALATQVSMRRPCSACSTRPRAWAP